MQIKTVQTTAAEFKIEFNRRYPFIWLKNVGENDVYVSDKPNIVAGADGVAKLGANEIMMLNSINDDIFVLGATTLECHAQEYSASPFGEVAGGGGGGTAAVLIPKTINNNGDYYAAEDDADGYSSVAVNVPNTYVAADEGKVVNGGALVSQSSITKTQNGTYDTTLNNEVVIDVPNEMTIEEAFKMADKQPVSIDGNDYYFSIYAKGHYNSYTMGVPQIDFEEALFYVMTPPAGYNYGSGAYWLTIYDATTNAVVSQNWFGAFAGQGFDTGEYLKCISLDIDYTNKTLTLVFEDTDTRVPRRQTLTQSISAYLNVTGDNPSYSVVSPLLDSKIIDHNGTYTASSDNLDGYSSVTVNVPMHLMDYSTTEQSTGTTWIDGKTVYQITFVNNNGYTSSDSIDISSLGFDKILYIDAFGADSAPYSNYSKWTIASIGGDSNRFIYVDTNDAIRFGSTMPVFAVTIRYTKAV